MNHKLLDTTKAEIAQHILPFIPANKRGFASKVCRTKIIQCIIHKLKTGTQWHRLFIDIEGVNYGFSWQLVYYYYRKWVKIGLFENLFKMHLLIKQDYLDLEKLNLDGTHSLAKTSGDGIGYQHRKKGRTSNVLILTEGRGIPISTGEIVSGNHNDLYGIVPQFSGMIKQLKQCGICVENSFMNADKGFDSKAFRRCCRRRKIMPNIKENVRNRKKVKRGRKREFYKKVYNQRYVNERCFAWLDTFKTLPITFDKTKESWLNWHYLAFIIILIKV